MRVADLGTTGDFPLFDQFVVQVDLDPVDGVQGAPAIASNGIRRSLYTCSPVLVVMEQIIGYEPELCRSLYAGSADRCCSVSFTGKCGIEMPEGSGGAWTGATEGATDGLLPFAWVRSRASSRLRISARTASPVYRTNSSTPH